MSKSYIIACHIEMEQGWIAKYITAAYFDLGFYDTSAHKDYTKECAAWLGWACDILAGDPQLMVDWVDGNWDPERFLVVEPGETIVASHDSTIIKAKRDR